MKYALAAVGFINEDIEYNKAVLADTLRKCAGRADVVIFGEAFLQGFYGINFIAKLVDCLEKCLIYRHIRRFAD